MRNKVLLTAAIAAGMMSGYGGAVEYRAIERESGYSLADLRLRNTSPRTAPKASQAKKRRAARRMHCGRIKNLRLRA